MNGASPRFAEERVRIDVADGTVMHAYAARSGSPGPGFVVLQEAFGVTPWLRDVAARLVGAFGGIAVAPDLYHRTGELWFGDYGKDWAEQVTPHVNAITARDLVADTVAAHRWLVGQGVAAERTAAIGFCLGGLAAWIGNAHAPYGAAVSYYGGRIPSDAIADAASQHGPILMYWGSTDFVAPKEDRRIVEDALDAAGKTYRSVTFSAGHGFFRDAMPQVYDGKAASESWALTAEFLRNAGVIDRTAAATAAVETAHPTRRFTT